MTKKILMGLMIGILIVVGVVSVLAGISNYETIGETYITREGSIEDTPEASQVKIDASNNLTLIKTDSGLSESCSYYRLYVNSSYTDAELSQKIISTLNVSELKELQGKVNELRIDWLYNQTNLIVDETCTPTYINKTGNETCTKEGTCNCGKDCFIVVNGSSCTLKNTTTYSDVWKTIWTENLMSKTANYDTTTITSSLEQKYSDIQSKSYTDIRICGKHEFEATANGWGVKIDHIPSFDGVAYDEYAWWNTTFTACRNITIGTTYVGSNLTNFPMMIKLNSSVINYSKTQDSGQDIRIVNNSCGVNGGASAVVPHEIEVWNESGNSIVFFKVSNLDSTANTVYSYYYGSTDAVDGQNISGVWDSNYKVVDHMTCNGTNCPNSVNSTINGTKLSSTEPANQLGDVGWAIKGDGSNDYMNTGYRFDVAVNNTVCYFANMTDANVDDYSISILGGVLQVDGNSQHIDFLWHQDLTFGLGTNIYRFRAYGGSGQDAYYPLTSQASGRYQWYCSVSNFSGSDGNRKYPSWNGTQIVNGTGETANTGSTYTYYISANNNLGTANLFGAVPTDEVRISTGLRSPDWIKAEAYSMLNQVVTYGSESTNSVYLNWYSNQTNSTTAGAWVTHAVNWQTNGTLAGYIFGFNNGTNWTDVSCGDYYNSQTSCTGFGCTYGDVCNGTATACANHLNSTYCGYDAGCSWSVTGTVFNLSLSDTYQDNSGAGSIEGARGMQFDTSRNLTFISALTDSYLTALNYSTPTDIIIYGNGYTDTAPTGSIEGIYFGTWDSTLNLFFGGSSVDDQTTWINVSTSTFTFRNDTAADTSGAGSQEDEYDAVIVRTASHAWLITGGRTDDYISSFKMDTPTVRPAVNSSYVDNSAACSVDGMYDLYAVPGTSNVLVAATVDHYITLLSVSDLGVITCTGSGYTDTAGAGSIEGLQYIYYNATADLLYTTSPVDGYLTILNGVMDGTPNYVGSLSDLTAPVSVTVTQIGTQTYAFVGSSTNSVGIKVINVTDPANPALLSTFTDTAGSCTYNGVYSLGVVGNYLYATSAVDYCFYSISLLSNVYGCTGSPDPCGTYNGSETNCERVQCTNNGICNGTSNYEFKNDSSVVMTGTNNWSNVSKYVNETVGTTIKWFVCGNAESGQNCTPTFSYLTTEGAICEPGSCEPCESQGECESAECFWWDDSCHAEQEPSPPSNCWYEEPGKLYIPPGCKYYTNIKEEIAP